MARGKNELYAGSILLCITPVHCLPNFKPDIWPWLWAELSRSLLDIFLYIFLYSKENGIHFGNDWCKWLFVSLEEIFLVVRLLVLEGDGVFWEEEVHSWGPSLRLTVSAVAFLSVLGSRGGIHPYKCKYATIISKSIHYGLSQHSATTSALCCPKFPLLSSPL